MSSPNVDQAEIVEAYPTQDDFPFPWFLRLALGVFGVVIVTLLIVAAFLKPSPVGFGTHQQLGLPPCSFKVWFDGMPCPSCGMTTSWSHMTKGQVLSSFRANPGGALLALVCMFVGPWLVVTAVKGQWWIGEPPPWMVVTIAGTILVITLVNWATILLT